MKQWGNGLLNGVQFVMKAKILVCCQLGNKTSLVIAYFIKQWVKLKRNKLFNGTNVYENKVLICYIMTM
jgi:hypothetical protein